MSLKSGIPPGVIQAQLSASDVFHLFKEQREIRKETDKEDMRVAWALWHEGMFAGVKDRNVSDYLINRDYKAPVVKEMTAEEDKEEIQKKCRAWKSYYPGTTVEVIEPVKEE